MANKAIVTGNIGPGLELTAQEYEPLNSVEFDLDHKVINLMYEGYKLISVQYSDISSVSFSISGDDTVVTISN